MSEQLVSLVVFAVAMTFSPGPNNVLMATSGVQVGLRGSVPLGAGIVTGMALLMAISAIGLGTVVEQSPALQVAMKTVGSAYLLWLGMHIARAEGIDLSNAEGWPRRGFRAGFLNTLLNPKGWTMGLGAAAGYASLAPTAPQLAVLLTAVMAIVMVPNWFLWCGGGQAIARALRTERAWRTANIVLGLLVMVSIVPMWLEG